MLNKIFAFILLTLPTLALADTTYFIREGDTVLKIADKFIGTKGAKKDPRRYAFAKKILAKNPGIEDSNLLTPGQSIIVPDFFEKKDPKVITIVMDENDKSTVEGAADSNTIDENAAPGRQPVIIPKDQKVASAIVATDIPQTAEAPKPEPTVVTTPEVPQKAPTETPVIKTEPPRKSPPLDYFAIQPRMDFTNYKITNRSTDRESTVNSRVNTGIDLQYGRSFNQSARLLLGLGANYVQLGSFDDGTNSLSHTIQWQKHVSLGVAYDLTSRLHLTVKADGSDRLFVIPNGLNSFDVKNIFVPGAEISLAWDFVQSNRFLVGATVGGHYFGSVSKDGISYDSSFDPGASLYWMSQRGSEHLNYRLSAEYFLRNQNTDVTKQREENVGFGVTILLPAGF